MFGFSVYLNDWSQEKEKYIHKMADCGFKGIFTSLHIPEDDVSKYLDRLTHLLEIAKRRDLKLMIDISGDALKHIGLSIDNPLHVLESGINGLRMDGGISWKAIAGLSNRLTVGLNASTLTENDYHQLVQYHADFNNIEAWHNYYPRPETGLDETWFLEKNRRLKSRHFKITAFTPGDEALRLPLYETLPTLEIHRHRSPLASALSLMNNYQVDSVYIGDPDLSNVSRGQFREYLDHNVLLLHAASVCKKWDPYMYREHRNRTDPGKYVIRSETSRMRNRHEDIQPENTELRRKGSITIDNNLYKRYKGELQIVKKELPSDIRVNVIGQIIDSDLPLLELIQSGTKFKITDIPGGRTMNLEELTTEQRNESTMNLDTLSALDVLRLMNEEDQSVPLSVRKALPQIEQVVEAAEQSFNSGAHLIYVGAGTSGRLGILDAAECVPTFSADPSMVQGLIAGGPRAMTAAVEGAEDSPILGAEDLKNIHLTEKDTVLGIAASGRTPYVIGALDYACQIGAATASLACNENAEISKHADTAIEIPVGPEVLTGSTRLKSGTAQKLVLNMISTAAMIGIGKVYKNLMVDVKPTNEKLVERAKSIIMQAAECDYATADQAFHAADENVKLAIVMVLTDLSKEEAEQRLNKAKGFIRKIV